jgi:hypothetical protein
MIDSKVVSRIAMGLVRVQDIVEGRWVYGSISDSDRAAVQQMYNESVDSGLDHNDSSLGLYEFFKKQHEESLNEITTVGTTGTVGTAGTPATGNVANTAPATTSTVTNKPMSQQGVDALGQMLKSAGLNPSQLNQVISKAK